MGVNPFQYQTKGSFQGDGRQPFFVVPVLHLPVSPPFCCTHSYKLPANCPCILIAFELHRIVNVKYRTYENNLYW